MLEDDGWFFVDSTGFEKNRIYNNTWFYHANGKMDSIDTWDLKKKILDKFGIKES
jgi:acyl carrier protein